MTETGTASGWGREKDGAMRGGRWSAGRSWTWLALWRLGLLVVAFVALWPVTPARQADAEGPVTMQVRVGFDGRARQGYWTPVVVDVENTGPNLTADLVVPGDLTMGMGGPAQMQTTEYTVTAALPQGARKQFTLYIPLTAAASEVPVRLVQNGTTLVEAKGVYTAVATDDVLVGVLAHSPRVATALPAQGVLGQGRQWTVVPLSGETLPAEPLPLQTFDFLLLGDFVTQELRPEQIAALEDWVSHGGTLILVGGGEARRTLGGLPPSLLPVDLNGSMPAQLPPFIAEWGGHALPADRLVTVSTGQPRSGRPLGSGQLGDAMPPVVLADRGAGHIVFLAFDPSVEPLAGWTGLPGFWREVLAHVEPDVLVPATSGMSGPMGMPRAMLLQQQQGAMTGALSNMPALDLPSVDLLAGLIIAYVILVGPVNYLLLRRLRRRAWSWLTIPVLVAAFSGGTFLLAFSNKGSDVITSTISVLHLSPDSPRQQVDSYVGVFAPSETSYRVGLDGAGLVSSAGSGFYGRGGPYGFGQGELPVGMRVRQDEGAVDLLGMSMWSMRSIWTQYSIEMPGGIDLQVHLESGGLKGTVRNTTNLHLRDTHLIVSGSYADMGDLGPGATAEFEIKTLTNWSPASGGPPPAYQIYQASFQGPPTAQDRELMRKQQVLESLLNPGMGGPLTAGNAPLIFVGWTDDVSPEMTVDHKSTRGIAMTAVLATLPIRPLGRYEVPAGLLRGTPIATEGSGSFLGSVIGKGMPGGFQLAEGSVTVQFSAPSAAGTPVTALSAALDLDGPVLSSVPVEATLFNWRTRTWDNATVGSAPATQAGGLGSGPSGLMRPGIPPPMGFAMPVMPTRGGFGTRYMVTSAAAPGDYLGTDGTVRMKLTKTNQDTLQFGSMSLLLEGGSNG